MSAATFRTHFDIPRRPVFFTDLLDAWPAAKWTPLLLTEQFGDCQFKVGSTETGPTLTMRVRDFFEYTATQTDEDPLYVFDHDFVAAAPDMLHSYAVPPIFAEDLFSVLADRRPPYRWLVMGPARTGASWHVDPALTSAWNALVYGRKRWALYPPGHTPPGVRFEPDEEEGGMHAVCDFTSLTWFLEVYPRLSQSERPIEAIQEPGETIFVPSGWWHCVLNLTPTIALTQNFVSGANLSAVCHDLKNDEQRWNVPSMFPECSLYVARMGPECSLNGP
jgi:hypothetical protein